MNEIEKERREQKRFILQAAALITLEEENGKQHFSCITRDVSSKGAYLITKQTLKLGTSVSLQLEIPIYSNKLIPDQTSITTGLYTTGTVIWSSENGMGVCFDNLCRIVPSG